jgi:hypothetical protein
VFIGFHHKPHLLATIRSICAGCQDRVTQELFSVRTQLRLFFVPIVPLPSTFRTTCAACGNSATVSAERADLLLSSAPRVDDLAPAAVVAERSVAAQDFRAALAAMARS